MKRTDKRFSIACVNVAALVWSGSRTHLGYYSKKQFWAALPDSTKKQIEAFVEQEKENPPKKK